MSGERSTDQKPNGARVVEGEYGDAIEIPRSRGAPVALAPVFPPRGGPGQVGRSVDDMDIHYSSYVEESESEEYEDYHLPPQTPPCSCPEHANVTPTHSHFHELLLDFFAGQSFGSLLPESSSEQKASKARAPAQRDRFGRNSSLFVDPSSHSSLC
jgi:hypothetical protein